MQNNPYEVLNLQPGVSPEVLKRRYRERLRQVHPDLNPGDPEAGKKTRAVVEAYEHLSDPQRRTALDKRLRDAHAASARKPPRPRPKKTTRSASPAPPRQSKKTRSTAGRSFSRNTVIINGQRIDVGENGNINVVIGNSQVHVSSGSSTSQDSEVGDVTMGSGAMSGLIMGDLYIQPNSSVQITGKVMGDVFASANSRITIAGKVLGDVHAKGCSLQILGMVMGDVFADPAQVEILGMHMGDLL